MATVMDLSGAELAVLHETGIGTLRLDVVRRLAAETLGTALPILAMVGSGIMSSQLSPTDVGIRLLENATTTAAPATRSTDGSATCSPTSCPAWTSTPAV